MATWIKLDEHEATGSIWYSLPGEVDKLVFKEDDLINCKLQDGSIKRLHITFSYVPHAKMENGIVYHTQLKSPYAMDSVNSKNNYVKLGEIEVDKDELEKLNQKGDSV